MDGTNGGLGAGAGLTWVLVGVFWVVVIGVIVYAVMPLSWIRPTPSPDAVAVGSVTRDVRDGPAGRE